MQHIYLDTKNFLGSFWRWKEGQQKPWVQLTKMVERVQEFCQAATESGFTLVGVADADTQSSEADNKWRKRREKELIKEERRFPVGIDVLVSEVFRECGVPVLRPLRADADDVLAALATSTSGSVLSSDKWARGRVQLPGAHSHCYIVIIL